MKTGGKKEIQVQNADKNNANTLGTAWDGLGEVPFRMRALLRAIGGAALSSLGRIPLNNSIKTPSTSKGENEKTGDGAEKPKLKMPELMDDKKIKARLANGEDIQSIVQTMLPYNILDNVHVLESLGAKIDLEKDVVNKIPTKALFVYRKSLNEMLYPAKISLSILDSILIRKLGFNKYSNYRHNPVPFSARDVDRFIRQGANINTLGKIRTKAGVDRILDYMSVDRFMREISSDDIVANAETLMSHGVKIGEIMQKADASTLSSNIEKLLSLGANPEKIMSRISDRVVEKNAEVLLDHGAKLNDVMSKMNDVDIARNAELLLNYGANPKELISKMNAHYIIKQIDSFLKHGVAVEDVMSMVDNYYILQDAKILLNHGVKLDDIINRLDDATLSSGVKKLLKLGADPEEIMSRIDDYHIMQNVEVLLEYGIKINDIMSRVNEREIVNNTKVLLKLGADPKEIMSRISGHYIVRDAELLLKYGVELDDIMKMISDDDVSHNIERLLWIGASPEEIMSRASSRAIAWSAEELLKYHADIEKVIQALKVAMDKEFLLQYVSILREYDATKGQILDLLGISEDEAKDLSIEKILEVREKVQSSNAEEISEHPTEFLNYILLSTGEMSDERIETDLGKIEDIFIHNNLPYVGKVFKTFRVLHPEEKSHSASEVMERGSLRGLPEDGTRSKNAVLFNDLLKASLGSNNRDLHKYLTDLQAGEELTNRVNSGETEFTDAELDQLRSYSNHLMTVYNNTRAGKANPLKRSGDIIADIRSFSEAFGPTLRYSVPDRIVRSFGFGLGIHSCDEMLSRMDHAALEADARNREAARNGIFRLESGDLIKATSVEYLGGILQNGSVSKEFLNGQVESDSTPLDSDLNVLPEGLSGDISEGVDKKNQVALFGSMHCMLVMKGDQNSGRARFQMEGDGASYDPDKYEIWHNGGDNYGIRVGFPSTEIDYLIWDDLNQEYDTHGDLERMKFEVTRNGFYIPIVDKKSGQLIFSPEEYDQRRERMRGLSEYEDSRYRFADERAWSGEKLVETLKIPSYVLPNGETIPSTSEIVTNDEHNASEVETKRSAILDQIILPILREMGLQYKGRLDGDLTEGIAEIIDTGSTSRLSNMPGDGDFDFMMKLDRNIFTNNEKMERLRGLFRDKLGDQFLSGNVRAKNVKLDGIDEPVEIDVTFSQKTNRVRYSTDAALSNWYINMEETSPEKAREVRANIVYAKKFLKEIQAYKSFHAGNPQGGLGGVGVENWILQNGGSFIAAARAFMAAANESGSFADFKGRYSVFDYGENHRNGVHDNFVQSNIDESGYEKMKTALGEFLAQVDK